MCYNCLDVHVAAGHGDDTCFLWEGNEPGRDRKYSYSQVLEEVCKLVSSVAGATATAKCWRKCASG